MTEKIFNTFIRKQLEVGLIKEEDISIYRYGYTLMLEMSINIAIAIIIGLLMHEMIMVSLFLIAFIPFRSYAGGYHADKAWKCAILSNVVIITAVLMANYMCSYVKIVPFVLMEVVLGIFIFKMAPVQSMNKKLSELEMAYYKKIVLLIYSIETVSGILILLRGYSNIACLFILAHIVVILSLIFGKFQIEKD